MRPPLAVLLLACLLVTSGCLGLGGDQRPPSDQQAQDALDRSRTALADVTSYRARLDGTANGSADDREVSVPLRGEALVNVSTREMNGTVTVSDPNSPGHRPRQLYVTGHTAYTECRLAGWGRQNLSASRGWFELTPIGDELAVLDEAPVYWEGTERLDGTETAVVVAHPTEQELQAAPNVMALGPTDPGEVRFDNATLTVWLSTETWRPLQISRELHLRQRGATVTLAGTWQFDGYDEPAAIERPSFDESDIRERGC